MTVDTALLGGWVIGWTTGGVGMRVDAKHTGVTGLVPATLNTEMGAYGRVMVTFGLGVVVFNIVRICCISSDSVVTHRCSCCICTETGAGAGA